MLNHEAWLISAAIAILLMMGGQLSQHKQKYALPVIVLLPIFLAAIAADYFSTLSLLDVHEQLAQYGEIVAIIGLTECMLSLFYLRRYSVPFLSGICAFYYGLMQFYQTGWFDLSFTEQALLYGLSVGILLGLLRYISIWLTELVVISFGLLLIVTIVQFSNLPISTSHMEMVDYKAMFIAASFTGAILLCGVLYSVFKSKFLMSGK